MAYGINAAGQVVGWSYTSGGAYDAFLYSSGSMVDLNSLIAPSSGWTLLQANAVNDNGQIVGYGTYEGETEAFLLTPTPAPPTALLLVPGLAGLAAVRRRLKK